MTFNGLNSISPIMTQIPYFPLITILEQCQRFPVQIWGNVTVDGINLESLRNYFVVYLSIYASCFNIN